TFAARTDATNKNSLYDSYMRAIRWASDRIGGEGVIGFVTNGGWIEGNTAAGVRKTLADEFSAIYVFNLRGNQRTAGETSRREGGKVFGSGSRNTVAIFLLVRTADDNGPATIHYRDIGDYLTTGGKLAIVADAAFDTVPWHQITPNQHGDWINQRDEDYLTYPILGGGPDDGTRVFNSYSAGLQTNRDAWVYNPSRAALDANLARFLDTYDEERERFRSHAEQQRLTKPKGADTIGVVTSDEKRIKWTSGLRDRLAKNRPVDRSGAQIVASLYRRFDVQHVDISAGLIHRRAVARRYLRTAKHDNYGFYVTGVGADKEFSVLGSRLVPDLALWGSSNGQFFPRYRWEPLPDGELDLGLDGDVVDGYR